MKDQIWIVCKDAERCYVARSSHSAEKAESLDERNARTLACRSDGGNETRRATSAYDNIVLADNGYGFRDIDLFHSV